ncbi:MAG: hypothetical protein U0835_18995 [Isosphaeraceae bacterium]
MKIDLECQGCGKAYSVDAANAGRRGRCSRCGAVFTVPTPPAGLDDPEPAEFAVAPAAPARDVDPESDGYALSEPEPAPANYSSASSSSSAGGLDGDGEPSVLDRPKARKPRKKKGVGERALESFDLQLPKSPRPGQFARWRKPLIVAGVALGVLVILGLIFPGLAVAAGFALVAAGGLLLFAGMIAGLTPRSPRTSCTGWPSSSSGRTPPITS